MVRGKWEVGREEGRKEGRRCGAYQPSFFVRPGFALLRRRHLVRAGVGVRVRVVETEW